MSGKAESLMELAHRDLALAKLIQNSDPGNAVFHLQQAAEKLAKAVLTVEEILFGVGHQIGALAAALPSENVFRPDLASFDRFSSYATATRYPLPGGRMPRLPTKEFLDLGIQEVASLVDEIDDYRRERATGQKPK